MEKFDKEGFIRNYRLTENEYGLLPENIQMAYGQKLFGHLLNECYESEDRKYVGKGYIPLEYSNYFTNNCCTISNFYREENEECFEISIDWNKEFVHQYALTEEDYNKLDYYVTQIAKAKANIIEEMIACGQLRDEDFMKVLTYEKYVEKIVSYVSGDVYRAYGTNKEQKEKIISAQLLSIFDAMKNNEKISIKKCYLDNLYYIEYLNKLGIDIVTIEEVDNRNIKSIILQLTIKERKD